MQFIVPQQTLQKPDLIKGFLKATQRGAAFTTENPNEAFSLISKVKPHLRSELYRTIFNRTLPFFSRNLLNVERDWNKVGRYCQHLQIIDKDFAVEECYTNEYLPETPYSDIEPVACCLEQ